MFLVSAAVIIVFDMLTKYVVSMRMTYNSTIDIIPGVFDFTYVLNDGAAWGMLSGKQTLLIVVTSAILIGVCVYVVLKRKEICIWEKLSLGLLVGGGAGNLISRITSGEVVDFINIHIIPIFNVADIGVTIGCILLVITVLIIEPHLEKHE